jgi:hypothetical protein
MENDYNALLDKYAALSDDYACLAGKLADKVADLIMAETENAAMARRVRVLEAALERAEVSA